MSIAATQTSLGQPLSGTQAKVRLKGTGSRASGEPFGPDSAIAGYHRGAFEKAVREIEDEDWLHCNVHNGKSVQSTFSHVCTLVLM